MSLNPGEEVRALIKAMRSRIAIETHYMWIVCLLQNLEPLIVRAMMGESVSSQLDCKEFADFTSSMNQMILGAWVPYICDRLDELEFAKTPIAILKECLRAYLTQQLKRS